MGALATWIVETGVSVFDEYRCLHYGESNKTTEESQWIILSGNFRKVSVYYRAGDQLGEVTVILSNFIATNSTLHQ